MESMTKFLIFILIVQFCVVISEKLHHTKQINGDLNQEDGKNNEKEGNTKEVLKEKGKDSTQPDTPLLKFSAFAGDDCATGYVRILGRCFNVDY